MQPFGHGTTTEPEDPDVDFPSVRELVDIVADGLGESLTAVAVEAGRGVLRTTVGQTGANRRVRLEPGTQLRVTWRTGRDVFGVPAELVTVHDGVEPTWELRVLGPVERTQRRGAVRAPLRLAVTVNAGKEDRTGVTVDLSEGGARLLLDTAPTDSDGSVPHTSGDRLRLSLDLDGTVVEDDVRLVRRFLRDDDRWEVSVRFTGLSERSEDDIRRRVFSELRTLRARGVL